MDDASDSAILWPKRYGAGECPLRGRDGASVEGACGFAGGGSGSGMRSSNGGKLSLLYDGVIAGSANGIDDEPCASKAFT